jgi:hypothetical protein
MSKKSTKVKQCARREGPPRGVPVQFQVKCTQILIVYVPRFGTAGPSKHGWHLSILHPALLFKGIDVKECIGGFRRYFAMDLASKCLFPEILCGNCIDRPARIGDLGSPTKGIAS